MQLTYRGVNYNYTPKPTPTFGPVFATGTYRGAPTAFRMLAEMPEQHRFILMWRGVPYVNGFAISAAASESATASAPEPATATSKLSIVERARALFVRRHQRMRQREQSMLGRLGEEVGLSVEDAAHYESQIQGKMPHDFGGYDRSGTAMS